MTGRKRFSIVLPVHNGGEHLKTCVASILAQTLASEFDLLILENASTDGTAEWLAGLHDPRVHLYPAARLLSIGENWARIVQVPRGEFMTIIGHDDLLAPSYLETMRALVSKHPEAGLYQAHFRLIDAAGHFVRHCHPMPARESASEFLAARLGMIRHSFGTGYLMRSSDYDRVGGMPASFPKLIFADDVLWLRLLQGSWKATSLQERFSYRLHESTSVAIDPMLLMDALEQFWRFLHEIATRDPEMSELIKRLGPVYLSTFREECRLRLLRRAMEGNNNSYSTNGRERLRRLLASLADGASIPKPAHSLEGRVLTICARIIGGGWIYRRFRSLSRFIKSYISAKNLL